MKKKINEVTSKKEASLAARVLDGSHNPTKKEILSLAALALGNRKGAKKS